MLQISHLGATEERTQRENEPPVLLNGLKNSWVALVRASFPTVPGRMSALQGGQNQEQMSFLKLCAQCRSWTACSCRMLHGHKGSLLTRLSKQKRLAGLYTPTSSLLKDPGLPGPPSSVHQPAPHTHCNGPVGSEKAY